MQKALRFATEAETKSSEISSYKLGEIHKLKGSIWVKLRDLQPDKDNEEYKYAQQQAISAYEAALKISPHDEDAKKQLKNLIPDQAAEKETKEKEAEQPAIEFHAMNPGRNLAGIRA